MKKFIYTLLALVILLSFTGCQATLQRRVEAPSRPLVAVGIVPQATFVNRVAGGLVSVVTLIPPGYSPANYQPTISEMQALSQAKVYFTLQMPTEEANIWPKVKDFNEDLKVINLRDYVKATHSLRTMGHHDHEVDHQDGEALHDEDEAIDPHIWLSPKRAMVMVQVIADELSKLDPQYEDIYQANAMTYIGELEYLDQRITEALNALENRSFLIYHGAYGYFAEDYALEMIAIETVGKKATASEIQAVIDEAKEHGITCVLYQEEFDDSQAKTIAEEIGGQVVKVAPLSPNYIESLESLVEALTTVEESDGE